jgi:hypothetical protein
MIVVVGLPAYADSPDGEKCAGGLAVEVRRRAAAGQRRGTGRQGRQRRGRGRRRGGPGPARHRPRGACCATRSCPRRFWRPSAADDDAAELDADEPEASAAPGGSAARPALDAATSTWPEVPAAGRRDRPRRSHSPRPRSRPRRGSRLRRRPSHRAGAGRRDAARGSGRGHGSRGPGRRRRFVRPARRRLRRRPRRGAWIPRPRSRRRSRLRLGARGRLGRPASGLAAGRAKGIPLPVECRPMDRATNGLRNDGPPACRRVRPAAQTPLDRATAIAAISQADDLMEQSEPEDGPGALLAGHRISDRDVAAAGFYGLGNALYRLDRETKRVRPGSGPRLRRDAGRVSGLAPGGRGSRPRGRLRGALDAYRQCEKARPQGGSRGDRLAAGLAEQGDRQRRRGQPLLRPQPGRHAAAVHDLPDHRGHGRDVAVGDVGRNRFGFIDPTFVARGPAGSHPLARGPRRVLPAAVGDARPRPDHILHLLFNMYALWYAGQLVERMYGSWHDAGGHVRGLRDRRQRGELRIRAGSAGASARPVRSSGSSASSWSPRASTTPSSTPSRGRSPGRSAS